MPKEKKKVLLQIESTQSYGRELIRGIMDYSHLNGPWSFSGTTPFCSTFKSIKKKNIFDEETKPDGIILRNLHNLDYYKTLGVPIITSPTQVGSIPCILPNADKIGEMVANYFVEKGFTKFAFCGFKGINWSTNRFKGFKKTLKTYGFESKQFSLSTQTIKLTQKQVHHVTEWLNLLPKQTAIMCCNDHMGWLLLSACESIGIKVPDDIAVVGVDDDDLICKLSSPHLSSIPLNAYKIGIKAAQLLDKLMNGEKMNGQVITHAPDNLIVRKSSDIYAIQDEVVLKALSFIKENATTPLQVEEVANAVNLSQRQLFSRFKSVLGRTVHEEIKKSRVDHISKLLRETQLSITQIAIKMGFSGPEHLSRYFKHVKGISSKEYRDAKR